MIKNDNTTKVSNTRTENGNERSFMQLCGVVGDLIMCPLGLRSWLSGLEGIFAIIFIKPM